MWQGTVNPPRKLTNGSIPLVSTKFRSVRIEVITVDCLSTYGGSIPPQTAIIRSVRLSVRTLAFHAGKRGSIPLRSTNLKYSV